MSEYRSDAELGFIYFENETRKHQQLVSRYISAFASALLKRGVEHDASKLEDPERETFARVTSSLFGLTYGSEEYKAQLKELGPALDHHYTHNKHHPEYNDLNGHSFETLNDPIRSMDLIDIVEMICDWIAATARHADGCIGKSITHNTDRFKLDGQLEQLLRNTAEALTKKGGAE